jgi:hypothetical protein
LATPPKCYMHSSSSSCIPPAQFPDINYKYKNLTHYIQHSQPFNTGKVSPNVSDHETEYKYAKSHYIWSFQKSNPNSSFTCVKAIRLASVQHESIWWNYIVTPSSNYIQQITVHLRCCQYKHPASTTASVLEILLNMHLIKTYIFNDLSMHLHFYIHPTSTHTHAFTTMYGTLNYMDNYVSRCYRS